LVSFHNSPCHDSGCAELATDEKSTWRLAGNATAKQEMLKQVQHAKQKIGLS